MGNAELIPPSNEVKQFAERNHVRAKRDDCGELIIPGSSGHIYGNEDGKFGVLLIFETKAAWTYAKKKVAEAGFEIKQDAECEGTALFSAADPRQVKVALKLARVPKQRNLTNQQRRAASDRMQRLRKMRNAPLRTGGFGARTCRWQRYGLGVSILPGRALDDQLEPVRLMNTEMGEQPATEDSAG